MSVRKFSFFASYSARFVMRLLCAALGAQFPDLLGNRKMNKTLENKKYEKKKEFPREIALRRNVMMNRAAVHQGANRDVESAIGLKCTQFIIWACHKGKYLHVPTLAQKTARFSDPASKSPEGRMEVLLST